MSEEENKKKTPKKPTNKSKTESKKPKITKPSDIKEPIIGFVDDNKSMLMRLMYVVLFIAIFEASKMVIYALVALQFVFLFFGQKPHQKLMNISNKLAVFIYKIIRYITLNDNEEPFPFSDFPEEIEPFNKDNNVF